MKLKGARDLSRRELALLRELVRWRDGLAAELDRATFRVASNDVLFEIARRAPQTREALGEIRGVPRGSLESRTGDMLSAVRVGLAIPEADLPRFPRAPRWDRDPQFDARVSRLRTVRDEAAQRLAIDPGVLCPRERLEAVARRNPRGLEELTEIPDLRAWQIDVLGPAMLAALREVGVSAPAPVIAPVTAPVDATATIAAAAAEPTPVEAPAADSVDRSPYKDV
jgi:ribonuclease D